MNRISLTTGLLASKKGQKVSNEKPDYWTNRIMVTACSMLKPENWFSSHVHTVSLVKDSAKVIKKITK